jgi:hypothetical protein
VVLVRIILDVAGKSYQNRNILSRYFLPQKPSEQRLVRNSPFDESTAYSGGHQDWASRHIRIKCSQARIGKTYLDVHKNEVEVLALVHAVLHNVVSLLAVLRNNNLNIVYVLELEHANDDLLVDEIILL